ncbi:MAG: SigB/SigF/SigG family RNA polymerase sigma factor [Actinomycetota bacterium]|nr:SigB/SigF/SigG family RNA polymerase sigma factor [Actinomycetota bacterium]
MTLMRPPDTNELFTRWQQQGDRDAREQLVGHFLPLARNLARRYAGAREPMDDLQQVANLGLLKAIDRFSPEQGNAFASFAVPTILGELKRYFRDFGWSVHVPRGAQEMALKVEKAQQALASAGGRSPSVDELAAHLQWTVDEVLEAMEAGTAHHSVSLDAPTEDDDDEPLTLGASLGAIDSRLESVDDALSIAEAARALSERDRQVLSLRFGEDKTQTEIAEALGVSQMQVSRILRRVIDQLRQNASAEDLGEGEPPAPAAT